MQLSVKELSTGNGLDIEYAGSIFLLSGSKIRHSWVKKFGDTVFSWVRTLDATIR